MEIRGRYRPIETVAVGGQGELIRALDLQHGRHVALKARVVSGEQAREQVLGEARVLLSMRPHPGLPVLREDFFDGDRFLLVMDWIEGTNLGERLRQAGTLPAEEVIQVLAPVAEALDHLHSHEPPIVHRDVKPANIILTPDGHTVLVDLGIAATEPSHGGGSGTRGFIAPEVAAGSRATPASDIFSFAATAFALLFGEPPRPGLEFGLSEADERRARLVEIGLTKGLAFDPSRRPATAMALVTLMETGGGIPNNLRPALSRFIGRESSLEEVATLLERERIVTLTGEGGMGKTRLAEQLAAGSLTAFEDGVWFVGLEALNDGGLVGATIARSLGLKETSDPEDALIADLKDSHALLILDNCEHLLGEVRDFTLGLLRSCPRLTVLATSRSPLGIDGENVYRVPPLSSPAVGDDPAAMLAFDSMRLFIDRASRSDPSFRLDASNADDVAAICTALDGIPLAIELAAARSRVMSPAEIRARISDRFKIASGSGSKSLRSTIDWSYGLLEPGLARSFRTLSVFSGGFSLSAAESLGVGLDEVSELADRSLLSPAKTPGKTRFRMLESIRAYAAQKVTPDEELEIRQAHLGSFLDMVTEAEPRLAGPEQEELLSILEIENDNIRAALSFALGRSDLRGAHLSAALWRSWDVHGRAGEGRSWISRFLDLEIDDPTLRARLLRADGGMALSLGRYAEAEASLSKAAELARSVSDLPLAAASLNALAAVEGSRGQLERERSLYLECLDLWRELGHDRGIAVTLGNLANCSFELGDYARSDEYLSESTQIRERLGDEHGIAACLNGRGLISIARGHLSEARDSFERAIQSWDRLGFRRGVAVAGTNIATVSLLEGDYTTALEGFASSAEALLQIEAERELAEARFGMAEAARLGGKWSESTADHLSSLTARWRLGDMKGWRESMIGVGALAVQKESELASDVAAAVAQWKADGFVPAPIAWKADEALEAVTEKPTQLGDEPLMRMAERFLN